jgi:predicted ATPase
MKAQSGAHADGLADMRRGVELRREQSVLLADGQFKILLAEVEARSGDVDCALSIVDEALAISERIEHRYFDAELHRARGEMLLKRDRTDPGAAKQALLKAIAIAREQGTRSFELRAALALSKLYQSTGRPAEAFAVLAPAVEGFSPTPEMPEIAEAEALLAALAECDEVKTAAASRQRRLHLQTRLGQAMMHSRGYGSEESKTAFARARTLAAGVGGASERFDAYFGLFTGSLSRGELSLARETAESFLRDAENEGRMTEASVARRVLGLARLIQGDFIGAEANLAEALRTYVPEHDRDASFRFGADGAAAAAAYLALASWAMGDVERARALGEEASARADKTAHAPTRAVVYNSVSHYHMLRGDPETVRRTATIPVDLGREHGMALWLALGEVDSSWARARLGVRESGMTGLREALAAYLGQGSKLFVPLFQGLLAELEAEADDAEGALQRIDEALALSSQTGERWTDALLHRIRGAILLKRDPANAAPAEEAFLVTISVAQAQKARSFEVQGALSLAKLYQSTDRTVEAHAVLAPALEGFSPTPEMPEIAQAQTLLAALAETEEVKAAEAQRQQRLHLQTSYGQAMMWAKGFSADETRAAFSRATELTAKTDNFADRFAAGHYQWTFAFTQGQLQSARELELSFLKEAQDRGRIVEAGVAHRGLALACYQAADFLEARTHCERALEACDPEYERETQERFHDATGPIVMPVLAMTMWQLGELDRVRELIERANRRASELGHGPSMVHPLFWRSHLEILRGDAAAALSAAEALDALGAEQGMPFWRAEAGLSAGWARGRLHDAAAGAEDLRRVLADRVHQGARYNAWFYTGLLAEIEAESLGAQPALTRITEAIALARQVETRCNLPFLHLLRGKLLLERDPSNPAPAEEAFQTALAIAQEQGARSWGLRSALSLAKLYQSTARPLDAHAVLAPALEGFAPTPEMPEIAEAQAVLASLVETDGVKSAAAARQRRLKLQTDYSRALLWSKGFSAGETSAALADASKLAAGTADFAERFAGYYGAWIGSLSRGDLALARQVAETFTREAKGEAHAPGLARACFWLGATSFIQGEFAGAWTELEEASRTYDPSWDRDAKLRFGPDVRVVATAFLANTSWLLGDVARARELIEQAVARAIQSEDVPSKVNVYVRRATLEAVRGDAEAVLPVAGTLVELSQEYGLAQWLAWGNTFRGWAKTRLGGRHVGVKEMQEGIAVLAEQESRLYMPFIQGLLADIESEIGEALSRIDGALALATETGERWSDSFLHRIRGEILLKLDPANTAAAEQAFRAAIAIAQAQKARSFELQAALGLAKLYQSTARPADAHSVLAPALEGFSPTPEMPEIAEAQALLELLAHRGDGAIPAKDPATKG